MKWLNTKRKKGSHKNLKLIACPVQNPLSNFMACHRINTTSIPITLQIERRFWKNNNVDLILNSITVNAADFLSKESTCCITIRTNKYFTLLVTTFNRFSNRWHNIANLLCKAIALNVSKSNVISGQDKKKTDPIVLRRRTLKESWSTHAEKAINLCIHILHSKVASNESCKRHKPECKEHSEMGEH